VYLQGLLVGMIFELIKIKYHTMKKLVIVIAVLIFISSCSATKESGSSGIEVRKEKKLAEQAVIRKAVESKRFIIKFDRLYFSHGGIADLIPRANYIIIDGEKAIISAGYLGRQYDIRPIEAINMRGKLMNYELTDDPSKSIYDIKLEVSNGRNSFEVYLRIGKSGYCSVSVSNLKIDNVRYSGHIVPIKEIQTVPSQGDVMI
jgi:hypothetical protein